MAWDTEATKRKLLDAGSRQFAAHGFAGTRMEAIGRDAGVNKERVYQYFGDKRGFYAAVLADRLDTLFADAELGGTGADAVGAYAGALFDRYVEHPELPRLLAWESLELPDPVSIAHRTDICRDRAAAIGAALPGVDPGAAEQLLLSIVTLVTGWWSLASLVGVMLSDPEHTTRRAQLVREATVLARAATVRARAATHVT
ncbi:TetR family transcriptional regulator [Leucobacter rhizosphaerae]|uniref:TetR family transcriptional regulator n=1 Tax=Leucobacter rhizosphaerae TaxID=2932245 RepID=A0ABY4FYN3_9MICO|nr:TetR family transcriptional regulator [Leucobacter rhizosphaerae]UOQ61414.1 TetR family transcriptional regulator [Leucobacter rhizosphaerae]